MQKFMFAIKEKKHQSDTQTWIYWSRIMDNKSYCNDDYDDYYGGDLATLLRY